MQLDPTDIRTITALLGTSLAVLYLLRSGKLESMAIPSALALALAANYLFAGLSKTSIGEFALRSAIVFIVLKCTSWLMQRIENNPVGITTSAGRHQNATAKSEDYEFEEVTA